MQKHNKSQAPPAQRQNAAVKVTAKTLAFQLGLDVFAVRHVLRGRYRRDNKDYRKAWAWDDPKKIAEVRQYLIKTLKPPAQRRDSKDGGSL